MISSFVFLPHFELHLNLKLVIGNLCDQWAELGLEDRRANFKAPFSLH